MERPKTTNAGAAQWGAFLELGFRPCYVAGCLWAALSIALWVFAPQLLNGHLAGVEWHVHEMLWGFIATIAVGFLLTAGGTWTGINPIKGTALAVLSLLWVLARIFYLVPGSTAFVMAAGFELLFFVWSALALGAAIYRARSRRNYGVPLLVLSLGVADGLFLIAARQGDYSQLMARFNTGLLCMAVVALLVARRVIPFFAMRAVPGLVVPMLTRTGHWQVAAGVFAIGFGLLGWTQAMSLALAAAGTIALAQVFAWKPAAIWRLPLLWILYVGYASLGAGLLLAAARASGLDLPAAWSAHVIGLAGLSVLIIGMVTRTAMGHLGLPLRADRLVVSCYGLVIAAAVFRLLALLPTSMTLGALHASAGCWCLAFALYLWRFFPLLIRPRPDKPSVPVLKPGKTPS